MDIEIELKKNTLEVIQLLYGIDIEPKLITFQKTRKEFEGDLTLVVFPFVKLLKSNPEKIGQEIGAALQEKVADVVAFNVIKGFLNLTISDRYWLSGFIDHCANDNYGIKKAGSDAQRVMIEYSSPNTNKPLHLGHIRNNLLGSSLADVLKAAGNEVIKVNIVNDRGIHICKSMLAWQKWGKGETPESSGMKGDHLVGKYYVEFDKHYKEEIKTLTEEGKSKEEAEKKAPLIKETQEMLRKWEAGDEEVVSLWKTMNEWVYKGFDATYKQLGVSFDKIYYESNTYLLGKGIIEEGLNKGIFYRKEDNSVWIDLTADGLDEKILLRSDGTSVYITQDIGTAILRQKEYHFDKMIYTVGEEQIYHFKVLFLIFKKLGYPWADGFHHLSYGMVELPDGKMKSREGTVVDADDLMAQMIDTARKTTQELGKLDDFDSEEAEKLYEMIGMGALKYFILKVDPQKKMLFDPKESIDFNGNTGPFIQYTHARIQSILRKAEVKVEGLKRLLVRDGHLDPILKIEKNIKLERKEKTLVVLIDEFTSIIQAAAEGYSPALIANYVYELAKEYNQFYHEIQILKEENEASRNFRVLLSYKVGSVIRIAMKLMGIDVPDRM